MFTRIRKSSSFANVLALLALFVALGGTAWAVEKNSVESKHILNETVRSKDVKDDGVKPRDVKLECGNGQTLIRGLCFDSTARAPVSSVYVASDNCRTGGGWLPDVLQLRSTRDELELGNGPTAQYTDSRFNNGNGSRTITVQDSGGTIEIGTSEDRPYTCVFEPLD